MLGGTPISELGDRLKPDIILECTGAVSLVSRLLGRTAPGGILCLLGVTAPGHRAELDIGQINRTLVLDNDVVVGAVNANRRHYASAAAALARADKAWLARLITRHVPLERWAEALEDREDDIKVVIDFV
jgi:threonine dehydrogenase-like Zn-dependent dehydrogenase